MYELSQDEKDKIRAEMEYRAFVGGELKQPKSRFEKFSSAASHPIVITILGGVLLTLIGALLTHTQQQQAKKYELLTKFAEEMDKELTLDFNIKLASLKVNGLAKDPLNRSRKDLSALYTDLRNEYIKGTKGKAALIAAKALFSEFNIQEKTDKLYEKLLLFEETTEFSSKKELIKDAVAIQRDVRDLAEAMGKEIKQFNCKKIFSFS